MPQAREVDARSPREASQYGGGVARARRESEERERQSDIASRRARYIRAMSSACIFHNHGGQLLRLGVAADVEEELIPDELIGRKKWPARGGLTNNV